MSTLHLTGRGEPVLRQRSCPNCCTSFDDAVWHRNGVVVVADGEHLLTCPTTGSQGVPAVLGLEPEYFEYDRMGVRCDCGEPLEFLRDPGPIRTDEEFPIEEES